VSTGGTPTGQPVRVSLGTVLTAIVTPFDEQGAVDEKTFVDLMHHLAAHGSDGIVVCGTTGESPTLSIEEHMRLVELACSERPAGVTIVGSAGSNDTRHAVEMTERATAAGVDAILSVTPYYNRPNRRGLAAHYREVAKATDKPIVLYNIPSRVSRDVPNDELAELAQIEHVDYVKQAANANLAKVDGLGIYAGNDELYAPVLDLGECGVISVASHVCGDLMARMAREPENRAELETAFKPILDALSVTVNPIPVKAALTMLGLCGPTLRLPLVEASAEEAAVVRAALEGAGLL
jgi:4-hydroxy-tetrahydrodipicolinate synthase